MNYYRRYVGDFARDTQDLSMMEQGAYDRMLDHYYAEEAPLPLAVERVHRIARAITSAERAAVDFVLSRFFSKQDDGWHQKRVDHEIGVSQKARANGKEGGRPPKPFNKPECEPDDKPLAVTETKTETQTGNVTKKGGGSGHPPTTNHSVPNGTGAKAPLEPVDKIFAMGIPLLTAANVSERNARSMLGAFRKQHADDAICRVLDRCVAERPLEPVAWLQAALKVEATGQAKQRGPDWFSSNEGIDRKARELGMTARPTESYADLKQRIFDRLREGHGTH